jgi:hypothetical protein
MDQLKVTKGTHCASNYMICNGQMAFDIPHYICGMCTLVSLTMPLLASVVATGCNCILRVSVSSKSYECK